MEEVYREDQKGQSLIILGQDLSKPIEEAPLAEEEEKTNRLVEQSQYNRDASLTNIPYILSQSDER